MLDISFYQLFQIGKQSRMASKVPKDYHDQLFRLFVVNDNTCVGVGIKLEFCWIVHKDRIPLVSFIRLGTFLNMGSPEYFNAFRFYDPVVFGRIGGFQLRNIDRLDLGKK